MVSIIDYVYGEMMSEMHPDWPNEVGRLESVVGFIAERLAVKIGKAAEYKREMRRINKEMWDGAGALHGHSNIDSIAGFMQDIEFLKQNAAISLKNDNEVRMLERQLNAPYFGRIDFVWKSGGETFYMSDGKDVMKVYIGVYGFSRTETGEILIYDWRAPISGMFYDYEPGNVSYESPSGTVPGEMTLKRQYRIEHSRMLLMFDSTVAVEDAILQDILGKSADNRMKTIVRTIQKDQNRAIRFEDKRVLAVQGPAGSGKTSIALHRAAYLLYRHRGELTAADIRLYTPNGLFARYISSILPELGEDDIPAQTLTGLAESILGDLFVKYDTYADMMERRLSQDSAVGPETIDTAGEKSSGHFADMIEKFSEQIVNGIISFEKIFSKDTVFAHKSELEGLFRDTFRHMPPAQRLQRMALIVSGRVADYEKLHRNEKLAEMVHDADEAVTDENEAKAKARYFVMEELAPVRKKINDMLAIDIVGFYIRFLEKMELADTVADIKNGILSFEDQAPVMYLMSLLGMHKPDRNAKQVIIDEAQDYSEISYRFLSRHFSESGITLLGDIDQGINPATGICGLNRAAELLDSESSEFIELDKSYRSTMEIMEFASRIIGKAPKSFGRHGRPPLIRTSDDLEGVCKSIRDFILESKAENHKSIAVICRTVIDCRHVYDILMTEIGHQMNLVVNGDEEMPGGIVVLPSYLAKGLEFDAVAAVILSADDYAACRERDQYSTEETRLFYMICTRALHRLDVCSVESPRILGMSAIG